MDKGRTKPKDAIRKGIAKRLREARDSAGISQDAVGKLFTPSISRAAVAQWEDSEKGTIPEVERLLILAAAYGVTVDWILKGGTARELLDANVEAIVRVGTRLPLISWVSAGLKEEAFDPYAPGNAEDWVDFTSREASRSAYCLRVRGDSMRRPDGSEPTFPDGCVIAVEPTREAKPKDFVVARFDDSNEATFKQYIIDGPSKLLIPLNPAYQTIPFRKDTRIVGVIIEKQIIVRY